MDKIEELVEHLFGEMCVSPTGRCRNPVTEGSFIKGLDPILPQKWQAYCALIAREWFAMYGPPDAPPLPLSYGESEDMKSGGSGFARMIAYYAQSYTTREVPEV
jgi:hypothetical protein